MIVNLLKKIAYPGHAAMAYESNSGEARSAVTIMTPPHATYVAHLLFVCLNRMGLAPNIHVGEFLGDFKKSLFVLLCPQVFKRLPASYIAFQMEQGGSDWFNEDYLTILRNPNIRILDYSSRNIQYLISKNIPSEHIRIAQLCPFPGYLSYLQKSGKLESIAPEREYDVLFYGGINERRFHLLTCINANFRSKIAVGVFGPPLYDLIRRSKIVVNLHVYEHSPLESTRIFESLSLGARLVSELSPDVGDYTDLIDFVSFVSVDQVLEIIDKITYLLGADELPHTDSLEVYARKRFEEFYRSVLWAVEELGWVEE